MKFSITLLPLMLCAPALAQTPQITASIVAPQVASAAPTWEFAPDFLRDQTRVSWSAPSGSGANEFFVTTINGEGVPTGEVVNLLSSAGKNWGTITAIFDKKGRLKDQVMSGLLGATSLGNSDSQAKMVVSDVDIKTEAKKGLLTKRTFTLKFPDLVGTLVCNYDARGRRQRDVFTPTAGTPGAGVARAINYVYDARGLSAMSDGTTNFTIERDVDGKMRSLSAIQNGLLTRSATTIKGDKGAILGTRTETYAGGILQESNEVTREGGTSNSRISETSSSTTTDGNGGQTTENKFEFRMDIGPKAPVKPVVEVRKHTVYRNTKTALEEIYRNGILTQRSEFNDNGIIEKVTSFNADGSVASTVDTSKIPYADGSGGIIRRLQ